jgi:hypothetical protein
MERHDLLDFLGDRRQPVRIADYLPVRRHREQLALASATTTSLAAMKPAPGR